MDKTPSMYCTVPFRHVLDHLRGDPEVNGLVDGALRVQLGVVAKAHPQLAERALDQVVGCVG